MKKKLLGAVIAVLMAAALISGCMDDAMDKSKMPQKTAESPSTTSK